MNELSRYDFNDEIKQNEACAVVFTAPWCSFCSSMVQVAEAVEKLTGKAFFFVVLDKDKELGYLYDVGSVPTTLVFKQGKEIRRKTGVLKKSELLNILDESVS